jgi:ElaB/YqjD/DUF883 family membrane-anchored ribosome-binding protein
MRANADPEILRRDIDETRGRVDQTLDQLRDRVSPRQIWSRAVQQGKELASSAGERIQRNPLPLVFGVTAAAAVLLLRRPHDRGRESGRLEAAAPEPQDRYECELELAAERARALRRRDRGSMARVADEAPLLLGALGIALGALLGAALPATEGEDRLLGRTRDRTLRRARELASQGYTKAREAAREAARALRHRASQLH